MITRILYCKVFFPSISVCQHSKKKVDYDSQKSSINSPELHKKHNFQKRKKKEKVRERLSMHIGRAKFIELELPLSVVENVNNVGGSTL
jgi:DNA topoisomerase VI subunit A